ncbi:hypothetical protein CC86DRAFT_151135 [Ophiobolus disseminans]|uniref:Uncharacterized protein n=1 Tax=Ophiobolus disseminans TaxID=1469910 RepID=A0A6A6ZCV3_9PLEO|nr:hypothetical protein CC86DRAFT_151135 [Ophiobolus disseminans]
MFDVATSTCLIKGVRQELGRVGNSRQFGMQVGEHDAGLSCSLCLSYSNGFLSTHWHSNGQIPINREDSFLDLGSLFARSRMRVRLIDRIQAIYVQELEWCCISHDNDPSCTTPIHLSLEEHTRRQLWSLRLP